MPLEHPFFKDARRSKQGFALLVITALFLAFSLTAAAIIDRTNATQQLKQREATRIQMKRISAALIQYYLFTYDSVSNPHPYPCPARYDLLETDVNFGAEVANCQATTTGVDDLAPSVVRGMVPVRALLPYGVDINDAFDAWNNRIMYVVDRNVARGGSGVAGTTITVQDYYTSNYFNSPNYIVLSYGQDGLGAIPRARTSVAVPCPVTPSLRQTNCDGDTTFSQSPFYTPPSADSALYFDDILIFYGQ